MAWPAHNIISEKRLTFCDYPPDSFSGSDLILMMPFEQMIEIAKQKGSSPISMKRPYLPIQLNQNFHPLNY